MSHEDKYKKTKHTKAKNNITQHKTKINIIIFSFLFFCFVVLSFAILQHTDSLFATMNANNQI